MKHGSLINSKGTKMYRHPKTMNAFFTMMEKFDRAIYDWAQQQECVDVQVKLSNSATGTNITFASTRIACKHRYFT